MGKNEGSEVKAMKRWQITLLVICGVVLIALGVGFVMCNNIF
jgi:hypothetical protein